MRTPLLALLLVPACAGGPMRHLEIGSSAIDPETGIFYAPGVEYGPGENPDRPGRRLSMPDEPFVLVCHPAIAQVCVRIYPEELTAEQVAELQRLLNRDAEAAVP